ncbi:MAG: glycosyltransferase [Halioglobus sp.]
MTIVLVSGSCPPMQCGVGDYTARLALELSKLQPGAVGILTSDVTNRESAGEDNVSVHSVMPNWSLSSLRILLHVLKRERPEIVHFQFPTAGYGKGLTPWLAPLVTSMMGYNVVQTWHEGYTSRQIPTMLLKALAPGRLIVVRENYAQLLRPWLRWILPLRKWTYIASTSTIPKHQLTPEMKDNLRAKFPADKKLLVFFGFVHRDKGVHRIFEVANPDQHHIVIAGPMTYLDEYCSELRRQCAESRWASSVETTGHLPQKEVANLLAIADAVVLPFEKGGGQWNTSIEAAKLNGAFVLTTSLTEMGYSPKTDTFFATPGDTLQMKEALAKRFSGSYQPDQTPSEENPWRRIAREHLSVYNSLLPEGRHLKEHSESGLNNA